jgi:hypothetical protein
VLRVDFENLLAQPAATLHKVAAHFALNPAGVAAAMASPAWQRYSKAQDHGYGRDDRAHDLTLAIERHGREIAEGEGWLETFLQHHPELGDAVA